MGIPSYFSYIVKNHPEIIKRFIQNEMSVANLYLDCNSIIYDAFHTLNSESSLSSKKANTKTNISIARISAAIISSVIEKIEEYVEVIQPTNTLYIAFDGVAPLAKLEQQRERRYKSWYQCEINKILTNKQNEQDISKNNTPSYFKEKSKKKIVKDEWNTASITPGTQFMAELNRRVSSHFHCSKRCIKLGIEEVIISGSDEAGEGEHKIFQHIRDKGLSSSNETTVIYGLDADLIMLSINHLRYCPNLYLFRETPHFIQSISSELEPNEQYVLDITALNRNIYKDNQLKDGNSHNYVFLCFFLGNDFLPHFPALNIRTGGIDKLLLAFSEIGNVDFVEVSSNNEVRILWANVRKLVKCLSKVEEEYIVAEYKSRERKERVPLANRSDEEKMKKFELIPTYEREIEKYVKPTSAGWENRYYMALFEEKDMDKERIAMNYLEGLEWTMKYYTQGCPDWRWKYKYHYPPLLKDLLRYIPIDSGLSSGQLVPIQKEYPILPLTQLCYVLPRANLYLLPRELKEILLKENNDWYSDECSFVWAYCRYFWEAHVDMPEIDIDELSKIVANK